jgi:hypothetical protein
MQQSCAASACFRRFLFDSRPPVVTLDMKEIVKLSILLPPERNLQFVSENVGNYDVGSNLDSEYWSLMVEQVERETLIKIMELVNEKLPAKKFHARTG